MRLDVEYGAISDLETLVGSFGDKTREAARIALNDTIEGEGLAAYRKAAGAEIAFEPGYLNDKRLGITRKAKNNDLAVEVTARFRATSLARFARGATFGRNPQGIRVQVKRGQTRVLRRAFLVKLKAGNVAIRDNFNVGLAIRLKPGERLLNTTGASAVALDKGLYLLYGPSVDQAFRQTSPQETPTVLKEIESEFFRQFFRLTKLKR